MPWLGLLCLLWCGGAAALSRDTSLRDLKRTNWGPKEGAPSVIVSLAQTNDGYLWIGNASGLFRFDGLRFVQVDLPRDERLSSVNVFSLFAPASGGLWIGFTFGGVAFLKDGKLTAYAERDGLPPGSVKSMAQDSEGVLWAGTSSGLARLNGSRWQRMDAAQGYSDTQTSALLVDSAGALWAASKNKVLVLRSGEKIFREAPVPVESTSNVGIAESPEGQVWLLDDKLLRQLDKNDNAGRRTASSGLKILFDRDGALWAIGWSGGVRRIGRPEHLPAVTPWALVDQLTTDGNDLEPGESGNTNLLEDREGNVWATFNPGLQRLSERGVTRVVPFPNDSKNDFNLYSSAMAAADDGALWVGGQNFVAFSLGKDTVTLNAEVGFITCVIRNEDGSVWFGGPKGLSKYASGRFDKVALPAGTDNFDVQAMAQERSGTLWISVVRKGVFRLANGSWTEYGGNPALPKLTAVTLATDAKGRVWFGYTEGRVAVLDGNTVTEFSERNRLPVGNVTGLYGKRSGVWAGGEFGLARFDGTGFRAVVPETTNAFNSVTGIVETADGDLWVNGRGGIMHITAAEIGRVAEDASHRVHAEVFNANDGVEGSSARLRPLPTAIEGTDGRLWFLTEVGLYWVDPARIHYNLLPPPVQIESLVVGDKTFAPSEGLRLPERTTAVRIDYAAPSLTLAEKVRYRYKLDGVDNGWQDPQGRRQTFYTNLGPGAHRFQVIAANNDGVWNETGAILDFVIPPTFVQTKWFIALCALATALAIWLLVRIRFRQLAARMRERFDERMAERERIARELHDTLLQSTQGLIFRVQAAANDIPSGDPARKKLELALEHADETIAEGRDRIQDLRIAEDTNSDLSSALAAVGDELAKGNTVDFRVIVEGAAQAMNPNVRDEAYHIGREALLNAFLHAQAKSIEVQIIYAEGELRVRIRDDGIGIDTNWETGSRPGHWGLKGMRERAQKIGAQLDILSRAGTGIEIELRIPAKVAYKRQISRSRWAKRERS